MAKELVTEHLLLRPWTTDDATAALGSYGDQQVARWLVPAMDRVPDEAAMRLVLQQWIAEDARTTPPAGRWAVELREDRSLIGGATLLPLAPDDEYEVGWQLRPHAWGHGYATEAARAALAFGFEVRGLSEILSWTVPANLPSRAVMERIGMTHDPADDFDHPSIAVGSPLRRHVLYRLSRERWLAMREAGAKRAR